MKIATWNVNSLKVRLPHVLDWLAATQADVLCLQETKMEDKAFPYAELEAAGYRANSVVGGGIATSLHSDFKAPPGGDLKLLAGAMPFVGFAKPEKIASVFAFLGSDDARFINGTEIRADGGALS